MKKLLLFTALILSCSSKAQFTAFGSGGIATTGFPTFIMGIGYDINQIPIEVGYSRNLFGDATVAEFIYLKSGYNIEVNMDDYISLQGGIALHYFKKEVWTGTDPIYSHFKTIGLGKYIVSGAYHTGVFYFQLTQTGKITILTAGMKWKAQKQTHPKLY